MDIKKKEDILQFFDDYTKIRERAFYIATKVYCPLNECYDEFEMSDITVLSLNKRKNAIYIRLWDDFDSFFETEFPIALLGMSNAELRKEYKRLEEEKRQAELAKAKKKAEAIAKLKAKYPDNDGIVFKGENDGCSCYNCYYTEYRDGSVKCTRSDSIFYNQSIERLMKDIQHCKHYGAIEGDG